MSRFISQNSLSLAWTLNNQPNSKQLTFCKYFSNVFCVVVLFCLFLYVWGFLFVCLFVWVFCACFFFFFFLGGGVAVVVCIVCLFVCLFLPHKRAVLVFCTQTIFFF